MKAISIDYFQSLNAVKDFPSDDQFSPKNDIYREFSSHYLQYPGQPHVVVDVDHGGLVVDGSDVAAVLGQQALDQPVLRVRCHPRHRRRVRHRHRHHELSIDTYG